MDNGHCDLMIFSGHVHDVIIMSSDHNVHCPFFTGDPLIHIDLVVVVKIMSIKMYVVETLLIVMEAPLHLCSKHERSTMHGSKSIKHIKIFCYTIPYYS